MKSEQLEFNFSEHNVQHDSLVYADAVACYFDMLRDRLEYWRKFCLENFGHVQLDPVWWGCRISDDRKLSSHTMFLKVWNRYRHEITGASYAPKADQMTMKNGTPHEHNDN